MIERKAVSPEDIERVLELRAQGLTRREVAEVMGIKKRRVRYIISLKPRSDKPRKVWYRKERETFTDAMPNPFPKWWCEQHNLDHNFYRPK